MSGDCAIILSSRLSSSTSSSSPSATRPSWPEVSTIVSCTARFPWPLAVWNALPSLATIVLSVSLLLSELLSPTRYFTHWLYKTKHKTCRTRDIYTCTYTATAALRAPLSNKVLHTLAVQDKHNTCRTRDIYTCTYTATAALRAPLSNKVLHTLAVHDKTQSM